MTETKSAAAEIPAEARRWATICHIIALVGIFPALAIGFFLGPLIVWLMKRDTHPFIEEQGKEAVNFQLTMLIAAVVSGILLLVAIGVFLMAIVAILATVLPVVAAVKANEGAHFRYPLSIRFIK